MSEWAVIFDLDGLLVDSEPVQQESFNRILSRYGIRLDDEDFRPLVGRSTYENFAYLKERYCIPTSIVDLLAQKALAYDALIEGVRPMPGAIRLVHTLAQRGARLAVASSSPKRVVERSLAAAGFDGTLATVIGGDEVARTKPAPDIYLRAVKVVGLPAEQCVAVEDSEAGVEAAVAAGLRCVAVPNRFTVGGTFPGAALICRSLEELTEEKLRGVLDRRQPR